MTDLSNIDCVIKQRLKSELKDNYIWYIKLLCCWFQQQISKEEFDNQARTLFPNSDVTTHNQFILSIMTSSKIPESSVSAPSTKSLRHRFVEAPQVPLISLIADYRQDSPGAAASSASAAPSPAAAQGSFDRGVKKDFSYLTTSCTREQRLPGAWMLYGRLMHTLNLYGLQDFAADSLNCLALATQSLISRVLLSALANRRNCRILSFSQTRLRNQHQRRTISSAFLSTGHLATSRIRRNSSIRRRVGSSSSSSLLLLERGDFGRAPPMAPISMREGYSAPACGAELNAFSHAARFASLGSGSSTSSDWLNNSKCSDWLRVDALLRCGVDAASGDGARESDDRQGSAGVTLMTLEDLDRVLTRPDTLGVGYQCLQLERSAISSALLRCLTRNRLLCRMRQTQSLSQPSSSSSDHQTVSLPTPSQRGQQHRQPDEQSETLRANNPSLSVATISSVGSTLAPSANQVSVNIGSLLTATVHPITNGVCVMDSAGELAHLAGDVADGYDMAV